MELEPTIKKIMDKANHSVQEENGDMTTQMVQTNVPPDVQHNG